MKQKSDSSDVLQLTKFKLAQLKVMSKNKQLDIVGPIFTTFFGHQF